MPRSARSLFHRPLCLGIGALLLALAGAGHAAEEARIAVLPVVVHSMDQQDYLQEGLADMLSARLGQHAGIGVIRVDDAGAATNELAAARSQGAAAGGNWVLFGSFTRFGNGASLDLRCVRVDGSDEDAPRSIFVQTGSLEQIIPRLSNVAERIAAHVHAGPAAADVAAAPLPRDDAEFRALRRRVEALEAALYERDLTTEDLGGDLAEE